ncbi:MAG: GNAT family N-acetyltransferase [Candidatus Latescibacteria bacterium]|nr:GNAT family N-acetyltransferase [bacterium]MBD3422873.1 GNAT family N-acetyltransferase [Candidatus Latescibacterota bacterium]
MQLVELEIEDRIKQEELEPLLARFNFSSFFNSDLWVRVLVSSFDDFSSFWITAREGGRLKGAMPVIRVSRTPFHYLRSLPFATYGTPLADNFELRAEMIRKFLEISSRAGCLNSTAVIFDPGWRDWVPVRFPARAAESRIIELKEDFEYYSANKLSSTKRKICRRSRRAGVNVRDLETRGELDEFYRIYKERSAGWGGVHPLPLNLFGNLFEKRGETLSFSGAFLDGRMLGCHVDFYGGNMAQAWISGVSIEGNQLGVPSYLIYHSVLRAYRQGMNYFNLGSSGEDRGLIFFKESLGGEEYSHLIVSTEKRWCRWIRKIQGG